jgi:tetratricopeptide (TPR) repeat protein
MSVQLLCYESAMKNEATNISIFNVMANRAVALRDLNSLKEAESALKDADISEQNMVLVDQNNLATIYQRQGRYSEALELFLATIDAMRESHGDLDSYILLTRHNLASLQEALGNEEEAIRILEPTFSSKQAALGLRNPATLKTAIALGRLHRRYGDPTRSAAIADQIRPFLDYA